ncbi:MAG: excinuclease ABC subunit UvrA, partial [bacterium]
MQNTIVISGARVHNLKNISVSIPRDKLVVFTGVSGSGKTSLAFDTIFAEGQRRYFETLSAYSRQFVIGMERPDADLIEGLSPAISVDQRGMPTSARSTVGTITEIYDYLRLLFTAIGRPFCVRCGIEIRGMSVERMLETIYENFSDKLVSVLAPVVVGRKGIYKDLIEKIARKGYQKVRVDGTVYDVDEEIRMSRYRAHNIEIVVDRVEVTDKNRERILSSLRLGAKESGGNLIVDEIRDSESLVHSAGKKTKSRIPNYELRTTTHTDMSFSTKTGCPKCGFGLPPVSPKLFSFNSPAGACAACQGLGDLEDFVPEFIIPDWGKSFSDGAIAPFNALTDRYEYKLTEAALKAMNYPLDAPLSQMTTQQRQTLLYGGDAERLRFRYKSSGRRHRFATASFDGVIPLLRDRLARTHSERMLHYLSEFMAERACPQCDGARLRPEALAFRIGDKNIHNLSVMPVDAAAETLKKLQLNAREKQIGASLLSEVLKRLHFLIKVGLPYLTLARPGYSLSGGEYQRVKLAAQIGTYLSGVTYVLDEPSVGLHQRDGRR